MSLMEIDLTEYTQGERAALNFFEKSLLSKNIDLSKLKWLVKQD